MSGRAGDVELANFESGEGHLKAENDVASSTVKAASVGYHLPDLLKSSGVNYEATQQFEDEQTLGHKEMIGVQIGEDEGESLTGGICDPPADSDINRTSITNIYPVQSALASVSAVVLMLVIYFELVLGLPSKLINNGWTPVGRTVDPSSSAVAKRPIETAVSAAAGATRKLSQSLLDYLPSEGTFFLHRKGGGD